MNDPIPSPDHTGRSIQKERKVFDCVVVNWNGGQLVRECVESIEEFGDEISELVVVDNGSTDGSVNLLPQLSRLRVIKAGQNLGFAKACNVGAVSGSSKYILFLNPDARLIDRSLVRLLDFMESDEAQDVGVAGVRLVDNLGITQESCFNFTDASTFIGHATGLDGRLSRLFTPTRAKIDYSISQVVDQPIGAFFLVRRSLFERLNGFDERFFVYFEEVDLALRAKQLGWKAFYFSEAVAYHKGGGVSDRVKPSRLFYTLRSRIIYAAKHFSTFGFIVTAFSTVALEPLTRLIRAAFRRSWTDFTDTIKAYFLLYKELPKIARDIFSANANTHRVSGGSAGSDGRP